MTAHAAERSELIAEPPALARNQPYRCSTRDRFRWLRQVVACRNMGVVMDRGRRSVLVLPVLLAAGAQRASGAEPSRSGAPEPLRVGMSTALSGPALGLGTGMKAGVEAYFNRV